MPVVAIILICIGCALILAGFVYLGVVIVRLIRAARAVGIKNMDDGQIVVRKAEGLEPRFRRLERNQTALMDSLQKLSEETSKLTYLKDELDKAAWHITSLKK